MNKVMQEATAVADITSGSTLEVSGTCGAPTIRLEAVSRGGADDIGPGPLLSAGRLRRIVRRVVALTPEQTADKHIEKRIVQ